ncbi:MAG: helix-turn-helix transcriptional regulator [Planctomycetes bacterium]|nr:helix-turn-helix transcriptional regulator [Planctomycetota bacterium]
MPRDVYLSVILCILIFMIPIGKILKSLRSQKGISLLRMGKEVGISFNTLNAYERNAIHPTLESCYKMSRFFDVPMEYFIFGDKLTQEYRDAELKALFKEVDELKSTDRKVIKSYLNKFLKTKRQMEELIAQAEEDT